MQEIDLSDEGLTIHPSYYMVYILNVDYHTLILHHHHHLEECDLPMFYFHNWYIHIVRNLVAAIDHGFLAIIALEHQLLFWKRVEYTIQLKKTNSLCNF